jgi:hypothetical protein
MASVYLLHQVIHLQSLKNEAILNAVSNCIQKQSKKTDVTIANNQSLEFQVLMVASMQMTVFCDVGPRNLVETD